MSSRYLVSTVVLCVMVMSASVVVAAVIPGNSILVAQRSGTVAVLNLSGASITSITAPTGSDISDVQQISPGGEIAMSNWGSAYTVERYDGSGTYTGLYTDVWPGYQAALTTDGQHLFLSHQEDYYPLTGLKSLDPVTGAPYAEQWFSHSLVAEARGIAMGPDGNLYVAIQDRGIYKVPTDQSSMTQVVNDSSSGFGDITFGPDGKLYAAMYGDNKVNRYNTTTGALIDTFVAAGSGGLSLATGIMFNPATGNLLVGSNDTGQILQYNGTTGAYVGVFASGLSPWYFSLTPTAAPEPGTLALLATGLLGLLAYAWRKRK
jgi:WD40 repeat protein